MLPSALKVSINATRVDFRQLGRSGLRVSNPILGGLQIGSSQWFPWVLNEDKVCPMSVLGDTFSKTFCLINLSSQALPLLKYAYDAGINTVSYRVLDCLSMDESY